MRRRVKLIVRLSFTATSILKRVNVPRGRAPRWSQGGEQTTVDFGQEKPKESRHGVVRGGLVGPRQFADHVQLVEGFPGGKVPARRVGGHPGATRVPGPVGLQGPRNAAVQLELSCP